MNRFASFVIYERREKTHACILKIVDDCVRNNQTDIPLTIPAEAGGGSAKPYDELNARMAGI